ncbi:hypothetical protein ZWY2020_042123 [Hordeum vulgare]|nr:hypothetical protein ZWY2020_042123 [Hordeum vulgare]
MESFRPDLASSVGPRPIADLPAAASPKIEPTIAALLLYKRENETTTSARPVDQPLPARPKAPLSHLSLLPTSSNPRAPTSACPLPLVAHCCASSYPVAFAGLGLARAIARRPSCGIASAEALCPCAQGPRLTYREALMTRLLGDGVARPKQPLPASSAARPGSGASVVASEVVSAAASSRSGRGGADRPERSPEFYFGTSLCRPRLPGIRP